jgi:hypothetical protein
MSSGMFRSAFWSKLTDISEVLTVSITALMTRPGIPEDSHHHIFFDSPFKQFSAA